MIPFLSRTLSESWSFARLGEYVTARAALALLLAFLAVVLSGGRSIAFLRALKVGQPIRKDTGAGAIDLSTMHGGKAGTPTMGGLMILGATLLGAGVCADWRHPVLWLAVAMMLGYGAVGFIDDYRKVVRRNSKGLLPSEKFAGQIALGLAFAGLYAFVFADQASYRQGGVEGTAFVALPLLKNAVVGLGIWYIPFAVLVLTATSNAVNLTDGLDGLAAGVTVSAAICFAVVAYLAGRADASAYLMIPAVNGAGELAVLLAGLVGGCLGFLWFNSHPAQVFMGDVGAMGIGGLLGAVALLVKQEFLLVIVGGVFVAEALSVMIQVASYKLRQKRVFLMSPLHHHFERAGWPESKIICRFWIVSLLLAIAGLGTLKIR